MPLSSSSPPVTLEAWLAHCERLHPSTIDLTLERVQAVAQRLPLRFGGPVFTVAGTNGKGSTCAMLEAVLIAAGYRVGVYTSPHLVHFEERCRIDGQPVQAQDLLPHFEAVEQARQGAALTYFEFTTLAILSLLAARALDAVVLEVGLGGRLDAVNAVDTDCAIITSIDLDHMDFLGPDREAIGREKAGIMRPGRPVVVMTRCRPRASCAMPRPSAPTCGASGATSTTPASKAAPAPGSSGPGPGARSATRGWPIRRCAVPTSCSTPRACWPRWRRCATACR